MRLIISEEVAQIVSFSLARFTVAAHVRRRVDLAIELRLLQPSEVGSNYRTVRYFLDTLLSWSSHADTGHGAPVSSSVK